METHKPNIHNFISGQKYISTTPQMKLKIEKYGCQSFGYPMRVPIIGNQFWTPVRVAMCIAYAVAIATLAYVLTSEPSEPPKTQAVSDPLPARYPTKGKGKP